MTTNRKPVVTFLALAGVAPNTAFPAVNQTEGDLLVETDAAVGQAVNVYMCERTSATTAVWVPIGGSVLTYGPISLAGTHSSTAVTGAAAIAWQGTLGPKNIAPGIGLKLHAVLFNADAGTDTVIRLRNLTTATLVDIGGAGVKTLSVHGVTPTVVDSVNLVTAAGFDATANDLYQLEFYTSDVAHAATLGGASITRE